MNWFDDWIQVFKTGTHTDSSGTERTWTQDDLDKIVSNYDASNEQAPIVLGHPKTDDPAYGWVDALKRDGDVLLAKVSKLCPEFVKWVEEGLYRKISIALSSDLDLRHIGFLGAATPAVKGLENAFCEYESDAPYAPQKKTIQPLAFVSGHPKINKENKMFKKPTASEFSAKIEELEHKLEFAQKQSQIKQKSDFLNKLQAQAKITAEDKTRLGNVFNALMQAELQFSENDESANFCAELEQVLTNLPARLELKELATRQNAPKGTYSTPQEELGLKIASSLKSSK
jgi:hypothetical protein